MKTININGIDYVKKEELDNLKKEMNQKSLTKQDLGKIKESVLKAFDEFNKEPAPYKGRNYAGVFKPSSTASHLITVNGVENGRFLLKKGYKSKYTVKQIRFLKQHINKNTTYEDVRNFSKVLGLRREMVRHLIYNINEGTFDDYI